MQQLTGLPINYLITVNFHGFKLLVNKLHGVYVDVDHRYINTPGGPGGYATIDLQPGYQKLDGQQALDFVRFRHTDSDLYRLARQQLFLEALKDRLRVGFSLLDIPKLIGALKSNVEIGRGGSTARRAWTRSSRMRVSATTFSRGICSGTSSTTSQDCGCLNAQVCAAADRREAAVRSVHAPGRDASPAARTRSRSGRKPKARSRRR